MKIKIQSWQLILLGLVLGAVVGLIGGEKMAIFEPLGELFIRAIHMIIVPVVFFAIVNALSSLDNVSALRRLSIRAIMIYCIFMLLASSLGLIVAYLLKPGVGVQLFSVGEKFILPASQTTAQTIVGILPNNIVESFASGNVIQILIFAIIFGIALNAIKSRAKVVHEFVQGSFQVIIQIAQLIMKIAPLGVFALIATVTGKYGIQVILPLIKLVISVYLGCIAVWVAYGIFLLLLTKTHPKQFFEKIIKPILIAFTTSSSAATLPVTLNCAVNDLKIHPAVANFLLPLGTSLNLNGLSVYLSIATVFAANVYGIHLSLAQYAMIPLLVLFTAMGAAAVPGSALIVMGAIQSSIGIPIGALPLIAAVDRFNDMAQTSTNVVGDLFSAYVVNHFENDQELDAK